MKSRHKLLIVFISMIFIFSVSGTLASAASTVNVKNSRVTYTLKDVNGTKYMIYIIGSNEIKTKGNYDSYYGWAMPWAGISNGDTLYKGDYKIYIQKVGSKTITYTGFQKKDYVYNATKKMIYQLPSRYKGQPDLFTIAETEDSNDELGQIFYVNKGKLKVLSSLDYTVRPHFVEKNKMEIANYDNAVENNPWQIVTYSISPTYGTLKSVKTTYYSFNKGKSIVQNWRVDWR